MSHPKELSTHAITSLTLGMLSILLPVIGLILGPVGIVFFKKSIEEQEAWKKTAMTGVFCSVIGIIFQIVLIFRMLLS